MREIIALEEQRFAGGPRQSVGEAITEIEPRRVSAALAEIPIGFTRDPRLSLGHRFDDKLRLPQQILKASAGNGIAACLDKGRGSTKLAAEMRRREAASIAFAQPGASGSSRRIAISAEVSTITAAVRARRIASRRDRRIGTAP